MVAGLLCITTAALVVACSNKPSNPDAQDAVDSAESDAADLQQDESLDRDHAEETSPFDALDGFDHAEDLNRIYMNVKVDRKKWDEALKEQLRLLEGYIDENVNVTTHVEIDGKGQWQVMAPPKPHSSEKVGSTISFEQKTVISPNGNKLTIDRELKVPVGRISPSQYADFLPFAGKVDEAEGGVYLMLPR